METVNNKYNDVYDVGQIVTNVSDYYLLPQLLVRRLNPPVRLGRMWQKAPSGSHPRH